MHIIKFDSWGNRVRLINERKPVEEVIHIRPYLIYATADEAVAYMFHRCFFVFFSSPYETTVLGNG